MLESRRVNDGALLQPKVDGVYACSPECRFCREICDLPDRSEKIAATDAVRYRTVLCLDDIEIPVDVVAIQLRPQMTLIQMQSSIPVRGVPEEDWEGLISDAARRTFPQLFPPRDE